jgi:phosphatidylserine decarboxylase precursor
MDRVNATPLSWSVLCLSAFQIEGQCVFFCCFSFSGDLLSVSEFIAQRVRGLFNFNERAVYYGTWEHGFFAMAAVGATNVGSIKVYHDKVCVKTERGFCCTTFSS